MFLCVYSHSLSSSSLLSILSRASSLAITSSACLYEAVKSPYNVLYVAFLAFLSDLAFLSFLLALMAAALLACLSLYKLDSLVLLLSSNGLSLFMSFLFFKGLCLVFECKTSFLLTCLSLA